MELDELGQQLHDRKTRGEILSTEEQTQLESWYAAQDRVETDDLGLTATTNTEESLRDRIDSVLAQIAAVTRRIQELTEENEALRREIAALHRQLAQKTSPQSI